MLCMCFGINWYIISTKMMWESVRMWTVIPTIPRWSQNFQIYVVSTSFKRNASEFELPNALLLEHWIVVMMTRRLITRLSCMRLRVQIRVSTNVALLLKCIIMNYILSLPVTSLTSIMKNIVRKPGLISSTQLWNRQPVCSEKISENSTYLNLKGTRNVLQ